MKKIISIICLFALLFPVNVLAQWTKPVPTSREELKVSVEGQDTTIFYLYLRDVDAFFTDGNAWGTQASIGTTGLPCYFTQNTDGSYLFHDVPRLKGGNWMLMFIDNASSMYVDRGTQANYFWDIVDMGDKTYRFRGAPANPDFNNSTYPNCFMGYWLSPENTSTALTGNLDMEEDLEEGDVYCVDWWLISQADYKVLEPKFLAYDAAKRLETTLEKGEDFMEINLDGIKAVYNNTNSTAAELDSVRAALTAAIDFVQYIWEVESEWPEVDTQAGKDLLKSGKFSEADVKAARTAIYNDVRKYQVAIILAGASEEEPADGTELMENHNFDQGNINGWTITPGIGDNLKYQLNDGTSDVTLPDGSTIRGYYNAEADSWISGFIEAWRPGAALGNGSISQVITGLPAGKYSFECDAIAVRQGKGKQESVGVYLFAEGGGVSAKQSISTGDGQPEHFELNFVSGGGDITLGLMTQNADANWMGADNFKLWYYGEAADAEPYAVLSNNNTVLTFYYDNQKEARGGLDVGSFNSASERSWEDYNSYITSVVFDASFANCTTVTSTRYWFAFCRNLTSVTGISNLNTENVTDMGCMFEGCTGLKSLDLSALKTDKAMYLDMMFYNCSSLTSLDVSGFNTSNVTDMGLMFYSCSGLTSLELSSFNTNNVTRMDHMFEKCSGLTTIVVSNSWSTAKVAESNDMFTGCTKLVGGRGTTYNANHTDAAYAHIDGGTSNPGYFTGKNVTTVCEMPQIAREGTSNYIIMSCATAGAIIYYTTNGTTPTENNTQYTGPIAVDHNCIIKAIAVKDGFVSSSVASYNIDWFKVATPTFSYSNLQLTISTATSDAIIYYTTNGSTPTTSSTRYTGAISLTTDCTVKAIAVKDDYTNSDVASFSFVKSNYTCQAPQISRNGTGNQVVMTCATSGASIYYTTDGTTPTQASVRYTGAITFDHNQTIRAVAIKDGMFNSSQTQFSVDWFKVATPTFSYSNLKLTISTATSGATIYYTIDGSNPLADLSKAIRYTVPVRLEADAQVKSVAVKTDFNNSDVASYTFVKSDYTCKAPQILRDGSSDRVTMSSVTENAVIYYTTDGSEPTTTSTRYTGPVTMTYNCTVRAIAARSDMFSSGVSEFAVDWLTISGVTVAYNNGVLTLTCASSGAEIHYEIGGKDATKSSPLYTGPITLTDNREVRYVIYVTGMEPVSGSYTPTDFTCAPVTLSYDGLNIILSTAEEGATIYYTTDGSIPTTSSEIYRGKISLTGLCTVTAFATKQYKNNSEMMSEPITYFFDGTDVFLSEAGRLGDAVKREKEDIETLNVKCQGSGELNASDFSALRSIKSLKYLNLKDALFENNTVPDGAFANMNVVLIEFPPTETKISRITGNVFSGSNHLAAIVWMAPIKMAQSASALGITNPNLLIYVDNKSFAPQGVRNIVENGSASSIVLTDEGISFWCPQAFTAQRISYTHVYSQTTGINKCSGWETIALPFDVQNITHEDVGRVTPFAANDASPRSFWLGELSESGFKRASEIKAYTPYIISMPNNEVYGNSYILAGMVTFEAYNTTVPVTEIKTTKKGTHVFTPCFDVVNAASSVYAINKYDQSNSYPEGSTFLPNYSDVKPFEAYIAVPTNGVAPRYIPIRDDSDTGIDYLTPDPFQNERVYDLTGRKVQGELKRGVYIINGNKVMVK